MKRIALVVASALMILAACSANIDASRSEIASSHSSEISPPEISASTAPPIEKPAEENEPATEPVPIPELPKVDLEQYYNDPPDESLFPAQDEKTELFGYINDKGEWMIKPQFYSVGFFNAGLAGVKLEDDPFDSHDDYQLSALIDKHGEVVYELPTGYEFGKRFTVLDGLIPIDTYADGIYNTTFIDTSCNIVTPFSRWNQITMFQEGLAIASTESSDIKKYGFINEEREWVIEPTYDRVCSFSDGVAAVMQNGKWGLIDKNGGWVLEPSYDEIITGEPGNDANRFTTMSSGKWGAIDNTGEWVIEPIYRTPLYFSEGLSIATLEPLDMDDAWFYDDWDRDPRNYGYIDRNGNWVIEPQYIAPSRFRNGLAYVTEHEAGSFTGGFIDKEGKFIWRYTPKNYLDLAIIYNAFE